MNQNLSSMPKLDCHNLLKKVLKQAVKGAEEISEIAAIFDKYKVTLDDLIHSSNN